MDSREKVWVTILPSVKRFEGRLNEQIILQAVVDALCFDIYYPAYDDATDI